MQKLNQLTLWDRRILSADEAVVEVKDERAEYLLIDQADELRGAVLDIVVRYNLVPISGIPRHYRLSSSPLTMPEEYSR